MTPKLSRPKKVMIRCDIEGVSGVVSYEQAEPGTSEYELGRRMFKSDLCACIGGLRQGGVGEIVVYDEHYYGRNIDPEWLSWEGWPQEGAMDAGEENGDAETPKASPCASCASLRPLCAPLGFIAGKPPYRADWAGGLDASFAGVILVGFHSKYGTPGGLLHHSYELDIRDLRLNGVSVGEIGMETAIAGDYGVPLLLVTGDSAGCAEAEALVPGVKTVAVKESLDETGGRCLPLSVSAEMIREAAREVAANPPTVKPWNLGHGVTLEVGFNPGLYADAVRRLYATDLNDDGDLVLYGETATAVWAEYWQRKLAAQANMR